MKRKLTILYKNKHEKNKLQKKNQILFLADKIYKRKTIN